MYSPEEVARRGEEIYERLRPMLEKNHGMVLVIDISTGAYEMDSDHRRAVERANEHYPNALTSDVRYLFNLGTSAARD